MRASICVLLFSVSVCPSLAAQVSPGQQGTIEEYQREHPQARFSGALFHEHAGPLDEVGSASMIYGTALSVGASPLESAENHLAEVRALLPAEIGVLEPQVTPDGEIVLGSMWDRVTRTYEFSTFRFRQVHNGVPVFRSGVGFLVRNEANHPLVMSTFDVKDLASLNTSVVAGPGSRQVSGEMLAAARRLLDDRLFERGVVPLDPPFPAETSEEGLVVWAGTDGVLAQPAFALRFVVTRGPALGSEHYQRFLLLASVDDGEILHSEDLVQSFEDVVGTVTGRATQGLNALECDPEVEIPMPYIEANVVGGNSVFADVAGQFVIPHGGTSSVTVRSRLRGQYFEVFDNSAGGSIPQVSASVTPPGPVNLLHNPTPGQEFPTAGVNAYVEANRVRDYTLFYAPNFPVIGTQQFFDVVVNQNDTCNAFYNGSSVVFFRNGGGCNNTSFSDVVHHEYGHHLVNVTGNGQGAFGEGAGDCMGVLTQDDPILGQGFQTCGQGIRNADNNMQYPCSGAIHTCGQLISGCIWSLRNELIVSEPADYRDIGASLFVNMLIVRGQMFPGSTTIDPAITVIYLELDDDDADIGNGTPHYAEIASAFGSHNMDAPELDLLSFSFPTGRPDHVDPAGGVVEFTVAVTGQAATPAPGTGVLHVDRGSGVETFALSEASANVYEVVFPAIACGSTATYYFSAETTSGGTVVHPTGAPAVRYSAIAASSVTQTFEDDFETDMGWSTSGSASDGQWSRGIPVGGGDRGDPPTDADGSGRCYLTDNVDGNSDVDGGSTILTSPVLDADPGGAGEALLSYYRWYSNDFGGDPMNDVFVVEISNNGGSTWVNLETVGPAGPEVSGGWFEKTFRIADFLAPTSNMRLRFTASDLGGGSVVEAGVDGVRIRTAECGPAAPSADFNGAPTSGAAPLGVAFADLSTGEITSWSWSFGDGGTSALQDPSHTYAASGSYTVSLTVTGPSGSDTLTRTSYIDVSAAAPVAGFSGAPTSGVAPLGVAFGDASSGEIDTFSWSFGDGGTSSAQDPSHVYGLSGSYTVSLTVTGPGGADTLTRTSYIDVAAAAPVAGFSGAPTSGVAPLAVAFSDASAGEIATFSWSFGDGGTSTQQNPSHTYALSGTYTVALTVTGPGGSDTLMRTSYIDVSAAPPVAGFSGAPTSGVAPLAVVFSNASSGEIDTFSWSFGDGGTSTQQNPSHTYALSGTYTVALTVSGPGGADTLTRTSYIDVAAAPPVAGFSGAPTSGVAPLAVAFSDASAGEIDTFSWSFGDGGTSSAQDPSHVYALSGTYTVALTVSGPGGSDTLTRTDYVDVSAAAPVAGFSGAPTSGVAPLAVAFSDASAGEIDTFSWSFGDGGTSSAQDPSHLYALSGIYTVSLTVTGPGGSDTLTRTGYIDVASAPPVAGFSGAPTSGVAPLTVAFSDASSGEIDTFSWSFGDGGTSSAQDPSHVYALSGTYTVALTVSGPGGSDTLTRTDYVDVSALPPVAEFTGAPTMGAAPLVVTFTDLSSGEIDSWAWDFGDGGSSSLQNPVHTYTSSGTHTVELTVTGPGGSDTETLVDYITVDPVVIGTNYCSPNLPNSTGQPSSLMATGSANVALNDVTLTSSNMPTGEFGYYLASPTQGFIPMPGGSSGNFCLGGGVLLGRYDDMVLSSGATGTFSMDVDLTAVPTAAMPGSTAIQPGDTWNFQAWHRDGATSNFTDGVSILFE